MLVTHIVYDPVSEFRHGGATQQTAFILLCFDCVLRQLTAAAPSARLRRGSLNSTGHIITAQMDCK